jgi:uncharacterized protein (TIGR02996 family)
MNEDNALLAAIAANPEEETLRLVYADWLDENGQEAFAYLVRTNFGAEAILYYAALRPTHYWEYSNGNLHFATPAVGAFQSAN